MLTTLFATPQAKALTAVLLIQMVIFYAIPTHEYVPTIRPLEEMPQAIGDWTLRSESRPEQEVQDLLKADAALTRQFSRGDDSLSLFVAFFKSQRAGVVPHSPRVCLPGAGWTPGEQGVVTVEVPGRAQPITINRFVVARGEAKSIVYYWYQSPHRIVASELRAKVYLVYDSLRYQRSDTSIVRILVPVDQRGEEHADKIGLEFVKKSYPVVTAHLPG